jgi:betaine lipid synthase
VLDPQRGLMGVVDFYTSRDLGNKERVSTDATRRDPLQVVSLSRELRADGPRPSAQRARGFRGSPSGSGSAGSRWTTYIFTPRDAVSNTLLHRKPARPADRADYLEYKMGTIKLYNARNNFLNSWLVQIP